MSAIASDKRIYLVGGPGGVGKTTAAAALGVRLAQKGYRTVVLTVDPARRLAQALGFQDFSSDLQPVPLADASGTLHATMLDTQRYFDKVIDRFAASPAQKDKILANPIYRIMVDNLGGTHEYAAMERLLEFASDDRFERIVVDTPPTQNAVDLLSAPQRMADFMDNSVLKWFQGPKPMYLALFQQGTRLAVKMLRKLFGEEFFERFESFMEDLSSMQAGFRKRNLEVLELLRSPSTAFILVNYPSEARYLESVAFLATLRDQRIPLTAIVLNRIEPACPDHLANAGELTEDDRKALDALLAFQSCLGAQQKSWVESFRAAALGVPVFLLPKQGAGLHDVGSLSYLGRMLLE